MLAKLATIAVLLFSSIVFTSQGAVSAADDLRGYRLSAGDKIHVSVFGEPDLSVTERVSDRGSVSFPLLGELHVRGMTLDDVERLITSGLKGPYLVDPRVSVGIDEYREFFVMGQVQRPGSYPYLPGLTVRKAISVAGGFTERASRSKVYVVSEEQPQHERRVKHNESVGPGDTVVVKESFF